MSSVNKTLLKKILLELTYRVTRFVNEKLIKQTFELFGVISSFNSSSNLLNHLGPIYFGRKAASSNRWEVCLFSCLCLVLYECVTVPV